MTRGASGETERRVSWRRASLLVAGLSLVAGIAHGEVPTPKDFADCNQEAREGRRHGASPNQKDREGAEQARIPATGPGEPRSGTGPGIDSEDPQLTGMDSDGARDPVYRAVYRVCMRKKGF